MKPLKINEVSYWFKGACAGSTSYSVYEKINKLAIDSIDLDVQHVFSRLDEIRWFIDNKEFETFTEETQKKLVSEWALGVLFLLRHGYIDNNDQYGILNKFENGLLGNEAYSF